MNETTPVPATSFTFMQTWGQLVWMAIVISTLGAILWYSVGPLSAVAVSAMLVCLELIMFLVHVLNKHNDQNHPLAQWFDYDTDSLMITVIVSMSGIFAWIGLTAVWLTFHAEWCALGLTMLAIGQVCLSESIHRVAHKDTVFHHRHLTTWVEPVLYLGAIISVTGGMWLIR